MKPCVYLHLFVFAHSFIQQTRLVPGVENLAGRRTGVALVLRNLTILFGKTNTNNKYKCTDHVQGYRGQEQPALSRNKAQTWSGRWTGTLGLGWSPKRRAQEVLSPKLCPQGTGHRLISQNKTRSLGIRPNRDGARGSRQGPRQQTDNRTGGMESGCAGK